MNDASFVLRELEQKLSVNIDRPAELGGLLRSFLNGPEAAAVINELLASYLGSNTQMKGRLDGESFLVLAAERFAMTLKFVTKRSDLLHTSGIDRFTVFRSAAPVTVDQFRIIGRFDPDVFDPEASLELIGTSLSDGSCIFQERLEPLVYDWYSPAPMVVAQLVRYPASTQLWFFHPETRRALFPVLGSTTLSSYVILSGMIAALGEGRAMNLLEDLAVNDSHVVRWAAIQAIGKLDGAAGLAYLNRSLTDRHPHISSAAAKTLTKLGG